MIRPGDAAARHLFVFVDGVDVTNICCGFDPASGDGEVYLRRNGRFYVVAGRVPRVAIQAARAMARPGAPAWVLRLLAEQPEP